MTAQTALDSLRATLREIEERLLRDRVRAVDVGAHGGLSAHWRPFLGLMDIDAVEPDESECRRQRANSPPNVRWHPVGLARTTGKHKLYVLNRSTGSSLYPVNEDLVRQFNEPSYFGLREVREVDCLSFSDFLDAYGRPAPNAIKLDTQGSELDILSSLREEHWKDVLCVEAEVEFLDLYKGQPLFPDLHAFLQAKGFRLFDLRTARMYRSNGVERGYFLKKYLGLAQGGAGISAQLIAGDALYFREPEAGGAFSSSAQFFKYLVLAQVYRYYDFCFWLLERPEAAALLRPAEIQALLCDTVLKARKAAPADEKNSLHETFWTQRRWPDQ